jgi:hypothetical protein
MNATPCKPETYGDWHAKAGAKQRSDVQSSLAGRLHRLHERKREVTRGIPAASIPLADAVKWMS